MHSNRVPKQQCSSNEKSLCLINKVIEGSNSKAARPDSTIRASMFVVFESRRSSRSPIIFILV